MPATLPMPDPVRERPSGSSLMPWATVPRSPSWDRVGASQEPQDPHPSVIHEAIAAAIEALADAELYGSAEDVEAAQGRLEQYQRVADRHDAIEDDQPDEGFGEPEDDWSEVVWLDDEEDGHGA